MEYERPLARLRPSEEKSKPFLREATEHVGNQKVGGRGNEKETLDL